MFKRLLFLIVVASAAKLPSNVKKCNRHKPDFNECMKESVQIYIRQLKKPNPSLRLPIMDPFEVPSLEITAGTGAVRADQHYYNCKIYGMSDIIVDSVKLDFASSTASINGSVPRIEQICEYKVNGSVLIIPVKGSGLSNLTIYDNKVTSFQNYHIVKKNGQDYWFEDKFTYRFDPERMFINFDNVVEGNKIISDNVNQVLNENWKDIFNEFSGHYFEAYGIVINKILNNLFSHHSLSELFD